MSAKLLQFFIERDGKAMKSKCVMMTIDEVDGGVGGATGTFRFLEVISLKTIIPAMHHLKSTVAVING